MSEPNPESDLSLVTTEDLVEELVRRHDRMLFAGIKDLTTDSEEVNVRWHGGTSGALGLCEYSAFRIKDNFRRNH